MLLLKIPCDQSIEQIANHDSKTKNGMTGFSNNKGSVNRWTWSHHARGSITHECQVMAGKGEDSGIQSDLMHSRMKYDKTDIKIVERVNNIVNHFEYKQNELSHIGVVATHSDPTTADARGESESKKFCIQRLKTRNGLIFQHYKNESENLHKYV